MMTLAWHPRIVRPASAEKVPPPILSRVFQTCSRGVRHLARPRTWPAVCVGRQAHCGVLGGLTSGVAAGGSVVTSGSYFTPQSAPMLVADRVPHPQRSRLAVALLSRQLLNIGPTFA